MQLYLIKEIYIYEYASILIKKILYIYIIIMILYTIIWYYELYKYI